VFDQVGYRKHSLGISPCETLNLHFSCRGKGDFSLKICQSQAASRRKKVNAKFDIHTVSSLMQCSQTNQVVVPLQENAKLQSAD
jgi:hypothetical protein